MSNSDTTPFVDTPMMDDVSRQNYPSGALYVIATPIGNLGDLSLRALHVLSIVDAIACEDTRNTTRLLARYGLSKNLFPAHQHNERKAAEQVISRLASGERIALVSDAGTPAVSDPGALIVDSVISAGLRVIPVPGPSAMLAALSASGLMSSSIHFVGFLPSAISQRNKAIELLLSMTSTLVFYEAPHRIVGTIKAISAIFPPDRRILIARELTKQFEELHRCALAEAESWLVASPNRTKGEFVLLLEGTSHPADADAAHVEHVLKTLLSELPVSQAVSLTAKITGHKKNSLYQRALEITR